MTKKKLLIIISVIIFFIILLIFITGNSKAYYNFFTKTHDASSAGILHYTPDMHEEPDKDAIKAGESFLDPVFKSFKLEFSGLNIGTDSSSRESITFEPNSHFIKYIEKNISQHPNITLEKLAVSDNNEGMSLTYFGLPLAALTSSYAPRTNRRKVEGDNFLVDSTTIDDYVISSGDIPDLIKLDIEGGEMAALKGSINTIEKYKPVIILEGGDEGRNESTSTRSCLNFLTEQGYSFFEYDPKTNSIVTHKMKQKYKYCNILCRHISNHIKP